MTPPREKEVRICGNCGEDLEFASVPGSGGGSLSFSVYGFCPQCRMPHTYNSNENAWTPIFPMREAKNDPPTSPVV